MACSAATVRCVFGDPLGLMLPFLLMLLPVVLAYFVIRLAVRHGMLDAQRQLRREETSPGYVSNTKPEHGNVISSGDPGSN